MIRGLIRNFEEQIRTIVGAAQSPILRQAVNDTAALALTADRSYAFYCGRTAKRVTSVDLIGYISGTPASGTGWSEFAIASGVFSSMNASPSLTILAATSVDNEAKAGATVAYNKTVTGLNIPAGTDLWMICASNYSVTQMSMRTMAGADNQARMATRNATRPSTNLNSPLTFTATPGLGLVVPDMMIVMA